MDFVPKTDWEDGDPYLGADVNRLEQGAVEGITKAEAAQAAAGTNAASITSVMATLAAKPSGVLVTTGNEARPANAGPFVDWVDVPGRTPVTQPVNMGANDRWTPAGPPSDVIPPSVPTGLASSGVSDTGFAVSWSASTGDPTLYEVFIGGTSYGTTASTSLAVTGRTASTTYSVTVRARDAAGNWSAQSSALSVTTGAPASTPSVKETLQTADGLAAASTLTTSALSAGDTILAYQVTDNTTANTPAVTSSAGTATLVAELAWDTSTKAMRVYRIPVGTAGAKTVTFPDAVGHDNLGIVRVCNGNVTVDGYATDAASAASTAYSTPAITGLAGSADRLDCLVVVGNSTITATDSDLTQRANPKCTPFVVTFLGDQVLSSGGTSPTYDFTFGTNQKGASIVVALKS